MNQRITSFLEIESALADAESMRGASEDAFVAKLRSYSFSFPDVPTCDPRSAEYGAYWHRVHERLAKRHYCVANEAHEFNETDRPYPYVTQSCEIIGAQFIAMGHVLKSLDLPRGASILEMGVGWGNIAIALSESGFDVTALDVESRYLRALARRAPRVRLFHADFFAARGQYDAVLFYESFHHCADHLRLLDSIPSLLKPGGILVLAGEPIDDALAYPWGLNPNGEALWQIVKRGWLELAFRESYLMETLKLKGWQPTLSTCVETASGNVIVCRH